MRINIALTYAAFVPLRQERIRNSGVLQRPLLAGSRHLPQHASRIRECIDRDVQKCAQSRHTAQIAVIAQPHIATRRRLAQLDSPDARRGVA